MNRKARNHLLMLAVSPVGYILFTALSLTGVGKWLIAWGEAHQKGTETFPKSWSEEKES